MLKICENQMGKTPVTRRLTQSYRGLHRFSRATLFSERGQELDDLRNPVNPFSPFPPCPLSQKRVASQIQRLSCRLRCCATTGVFLSFLI